MDKFTTLHCMLLAEHSTTVYPHQLTPQPPAATITNRQNYRQSVGREIEPVLSLAAYFEEGNDISRNKESVSHG